MGRRNDRTARGPLFIVPVLLWACASGRPAQQPDSPPGPPDEAAGLIGTWVLEPAAPAAPHGPLRGFQLGIVVDSARSDTLWGRVTHYMAGDMGVDPSEFRPFQGTVSPEGAVSITVDRARGGIPAFVLGGRWRGDTLSLSTFKIGPDEATGPTSVWYLVRKP